MALAVQRIGVRLGNGAVQGGIRGIRVVVIAHQVPAAGKLLRVIEARIRGRQLVGRLRLLESLQGAGAAEIGVGVIQARIQHGDGYPLAGLFPLNPGVQGADIDISARVLVRLGYDAGDFGDVSAGCERPNCFGVAVDGYPGNAVGGGVNNAGGSLCRNFLGLGLDGRPDLLDLGSLVKGCSQPVTDLLRLGLFKGAFAGELDEYGDRSLLRLQICGDF